MPADARPFFLYLAYTVPHAELRVPEDSLAEYRGRYPETPYVNAAPTPTRRCRRSSARATVAARPRAAFAAMITRMDRDIGRLMATAVANGAGRATRS